MKPAAFDYFAPATVDEALALLARHGPDARLLAGGQSLVPLMNARALKPAVLIDLNRLPGLAGVALAGDGDLAIGSMTRQRALEREPLIRRELPALAEALPHVGFPQTRNRGTLGGSLAHADPAGELPALALAYGARLHVRSARGERSLAAAELFAGPFATTLAPDELLASISFPAAGRAGGAAFAEIARRQSHRAEAGAVCRIELAADGTIAACELTLFGIADRPLLLPEVGARLQGRLPEAAAIKAAAAELPIDPPSDLYATAAYRSMLCAALARRVIAAAAERAARQPSA